MANQPPRSNNPKDKDEDSWGKLATDLLGIQFDANDDDFDLPDDDAPVAKVVESTTLPSRGPEKSGSAMNAMADDEPNLSFDDEDEPAGKTVTNQVEPQPIELDERPDPQAESETDIWDLLESWNCEEPSKDQSRGRRDEASSSKRSEEKPRRRDEAPKGRRPESREDRPRNRDDRGPSASRSEERPRETTPRPVAERDEFFDLDDAASTDLTTPRKVAPETSNDETLKSDRPRRDRPRRGRGRDDRPRDEAPRRESSSTGTDAGDASQEARPEPLESTAARENRPARESRPPRENRPPREDRGERPSRSAEGTARDEARPARRERQESREDQPRRESQPQRAESKESRPSRSIPAAKASTSNDDGFGDGLESQSGSGTQSTSKERGRPARTSHREEPAKSTTGRVSQPKPSRSDDGDDFAEDLFQEFAFEEDEDTGEVSEGEEEGSSSDDTGAGDDDDRPRRRRRRRRRGRRGGRGESSSENKVDQDEAAASDDEDEFGDSATDEQSSATEDDSADSAESDEGEAPSKRRRRRGRRNSRDFSGSVHRNEFTEVRADDDEKDEPGESVESNEVTIDDEPVVPVSYEGIPSWEEAISYLVRTRPSEQRGRGRNGSGQRR